MSADSSTEVDTFPPIEPASPADVATEPADWVLLYGVLGALAVFCLVSGLLV